MALIDEARRLGDVVAVSIFVNPLRFNRGDDFDHPATDRRGCGGVPTVGVDVVYAPTAAVMYRPVFRLTSSPECCRSPWKRPVVQALPWRHRVVTKLFGAMQRISPCSAARTFNSWPSSAG
jgi:pantothenate synthetase